MIITEVLPLDKNKKRVCMDTGYTFPLYLSEIRKYHIEPGRELPEQSFEKIRETLLGRIKERILYYITDADHSERDIRRKITMAGYPYDLLDEAIVLLKDYHYIDDERYARIYASSLAEQRHKNPSYIRNKLYEKGISQELIAQTMEELEVDEVEQIRILLSKKHITPDSFSRLELKERKKIIASLVRKGYHSRDIYRVLQEDEILLEE